MPRPADRPRFRRRDGGPPPVGGRVAAMAALLLVAAGLLLLRARTDRDRAATPAADVVVEVAGDVAAPGHHAVPAPARVHAAVRAAGGDPSGMVDATVPPGTRIVVEDGAWRAEPMAGRLVVGLPLDVNTAGAVALEAIPGIGARRAAAIVAERDAGGPYASVDDLVRVRGIGPATVEDLRPFLVTGP